MLVLLNWSVYTPRWYQYVPRNGSFARLRANSASAAHNPALGFKYYEEAAVAVSVHFGRVQRVCNSCAVTVLCAVVWLSDTVGDTNDVGIIKVLSWWSGVVKNDKKALEWRDKRLACGCADQNDDEDDDDGDDDDN